ncbi:DUF262 domain-containing protein [Methylobacterium sp. 092160098-2]|uniref:HNH endonuclease family protein n=1 Tax=Methylobacterium sp. 092160098-2 TaxID=3025129 RepID=UPI002381975D|nr:DUF262 domain-containing protein [Methylobacterium sp. 092160098-2]MDE4913347.1 DUF262 domain-containing protein [Methylobacterium sp. 092160098-2]
MATRVNLDAMIPRADFATHDDDFTMELFQNFPISNIESSSPIRSFLRKPDFQRETNHWSAQQISTFIASFLDNELIPSLILWKSPNFIFVIDGGHRLSALRAWMEDDYGDGSISQKFYNNEISEEQKRAARRARKLIEDSVGRFSSLRSLVSSEGLGTDARSKRARNLFTRALALQWVQGSASVAETSFFKINSQGTPLDDTEEMLLKNRKKSVAIGARSILRSGTGHKYWSNFPPEKQATIEAVSSDLYQTLFDPEMRQPVKTLDLPLGGSVAPVDALSLLVDFLVLINAQSSGPSTIADYADDKSGDETIDILKRALSVAKRISGNKPGSLGLHPAVYFYNERGKHSRFLFLAMVMLVAQNLANNNGNFFRNFTSARKELEKFLVNNKSLIGILLQNMSKGSRVLRIKELLSFMIDEFSAGRAVSVEQAIIQAGGRGRVIDVTTANDAIAFSEETKSAIYIKQAILSAMKCPICDGLLDPTKSVSYDHIQRVREGGRGDISNGQMVHPYCNDAVKS